MRADSLFGLDDIPYPHLADRLPSSLKSLHITDPEDFHKVSLVDQLTDVVSCAHTKFPCLQKITFEDNSDKFGLRLLGEDWVDASRGRSRPLPPPSTLSEACQKAGVKFRVVRNSDFSRLGRTCSMDVPVLMAD